MAEILFVDDEKPILNALQRVFHKFNGHVCHFANSPKEALEILAANHISVIVSDHKMPTMTGAVFLSLVKDKRPDTVRIMLTGQADLEAVQKAVNNGEIYRFILKPWQDEDLKACVAAAVEMHSTIIGERKQKEIALKQNEQLVASNAHLEVQVANRSQQLADALYTARALNGMLEETLFNGTKAMFQLIQLARPELGTHSRRVADVAFGLGTALKMSERDIKTLEISALLHDCGKLGMPAYIMEKSPQDYSKEEMDLYRSHPAVGTEIFKSIKYFDPICAIIGAHHERFDGSGFPNGDEGKNIATPAYIVGLADEYDHLMNKPSSNAEFRYQYACERIAEYSDKLFPAEVVQACLDYAASVNDHQLGVDQMKIGLIDLAPNLTLCRDIYTMSGCLLMAKGATLTGKNIARIRAIAKLDPVAGDIYVSRNREKELHRV